MAFLPVANSAAKIPNTLIIAMRPLLSSLLRISSVYMLTPKGSPKLPGSLPSCSLHASSNAPQATNKTNMPNVALPLPSAPYVPVTASNHGSFRKGCPIAPMEAIMATRPCLISAALNLLKPRSSPSWVNPKGSKYPKGSTAPSCAAGSKGLGADGAASANKVS